MSGRSILKASTWSVLWVFCSWVLFCDSQGFSTASSFPSACKLSISPASLNTATLSPNSTEKDRLPNILGTCGSHLSSSCLLSAHINIRATALNATAFVFKVKARVAVAEPVPSSLCWLHQTHTASYDGSIIWHHECKHNHVWGWK